MNFKQFFLILNARRKVILRILILIVVVTTALSLVLPKRYDATTTVLLNYKGLDPVTGVVLPPQLMPGYMATQVDILQSENVALKVIKTLGLAKNPDVRHNFEQATDGKGRLENWLADKLIKDLTVKPARESSAIDITFSNVDPNFAALMANAFADAYVQTSIQLKTQPSQQAASYFTEQMKVLRDNLEKAQNKLSMYQQEKGITSIDDRVDVETTKLNEMSTQLSIAQAQLVDANSRQNSVQRNAATSPDVALSPMVQNLKLDAARAESKLAELSQTISKNHPQYIAAESELAKIKSQLNEEINRAATNIVGTARINQERFAELKQQIDAQKKKVLELNHMRGEMSNLQKDVQTAQLAIDNVNLRLNQTSIEGQSNQSDISILNPAYPPTKPASPRLILNIILAIFIGGLLGIGFALVAEHLDRPVRSAEDIAHLLQIPVFAIVSATAKTPRKRIGKLSLLLGAPGK